MNGEPAPDLGTTHGPAGTAVRPAQESAQESLPRVAYQGGPASFSELALRGLFRSATDPVGLPSLQAVASALEARQVDYALVPVENTITGPVPGAGNLIGRSGFRPLAEIVTPVRQCLLAPPGARLAGLVRVFSHPVALDQCRRFLRAHGLEGVAVDDTAGAAGFVSEVGSLRIAALASSAAGRRFGLGLIRAGVEDRQGNRTRFVLLGCGDAPRPDVWASYRRGAT